MIRKTVIAISFLISGILCFSLAEGDEQSRLEYKPFKKVIYHISATGVDTYPNSPQIFETNNYNPVSKDFDINILYVPHREKIVKNLLSLRKLRFSGFGNKDILEFDENKKGALGAAILSKSPFLFPLFPKKKQISKIGDTWEIKTFPVAYEFSPYGPVSLGENAVIKFKWADTVNLNNFKCAKIEFSITDEWKDSKTGKDLKFDCNGTVYFAINEGVIVSEWLRVTHDVRMVKIEKKINSTSKFRLIHYEPYQESE